MSDDIIYPLKRCSKCARELPATPQFFHRHRHRKDGFVERCRECEGYRFVNGRSTQCASERDGYKVCSKCGQEFPFASFSKSPHGLHGLESRCKGCVSKAHIERRLENPDEHRRNARDNARRRRSSNPTVREKDRDYSRQRRAQDPEYGRRWRLANLQKKRVYLTVYRARKKGLPNTLTPLDWQFALDYWEYSCAVCGRTDNDELVVAQDHWIAISKNGGTTPDNIIPLCHGLDGCNNNKGNREPAEWLESKYDKAEAVAKLAKIEAYFETVRRRVK